MLAVLLLPALVGAQLGPARIDVDESVFRGCVDAPEPLGPFGSNVTCAEWAGRYAVEGNCNGAQDMELPPDCDDACQAWFREGNPLVDQCPETCGYCVEAPLNLLEPAGSAAMEVAHPGAVGHFILAEGRGEHFCLQGPIRHQIFMLSLLKSGAFGTIHDDNSVHFGPCSVSDFPNLQILAGHGEHAINSFDHCFPPSQMFHRTNWTDIEDFGVLPVGDLFDAMDLEEVCIDDWMERASWPLPDIDAGELGIFMSFPCFCLAGSEAANDNADWASEAQCEEWSHDNRYASFVTDDGLSCVEAHFRYANRALAALRTSSLARIYTNTRLEGLTCAERGFTEAAEDHPCYPRAVRYFASAEGPETVAANEDAALQEYAAAHSEILAGHSPEAVQSCSCLPGSPRREGLSEEACSAPELQAPVLGMWPRESM